MKKETLWRVYLSDGDRLTVRAKSLCELKRKIDKQGELLSHMIDSVTKIGGLNEDRENNIR